MIRRYVLATVALLIIGAGWYLFRPELAFIDREVAEAAPAEGTPLLQGTFTGDAHETRGTAHVLQYADGRRVLRFTGFETSNGPDVQIWLVAVPEISAAGDVKDADVVSLGMMKGNVGDQNYDIPVDVDLTRYRAVSVWCRRFGVNFGAAALRPVEQ